MKVGLYFGTFNPIHIGHLIIANYLREFTQLDEVWFIVSPQNPFKKNVELLEDRLRYEMVKLAIADYPWFKVSDIEFDMPKPSYTANTLRKLINLYPDEKFVVIVGGDNFPTLLQWKDALWILQNFEFYVYPRPGYDSKNLQRIFKNWQIEDVKGIYIIDAPLMEISATFIRNSISEGRDVRYFVHPKVWEFIQTHNLYK